MATGPNGNKKNNEKKIIDISDQFQEQSGSEAQDQQEEQQEQSQSQPRQFYENVVLYSQADEETKARMDELIAQIDTNDISTIIAFGSEPAEEMAAVAEKILDKARSSGAVVTDLKGLAAKMNVFKHGEVPSLVKRYSRQAAWTMAGGAKKALMAPVRAISAVADKMGASNFRKRNLMVRNEDIRTSVGKSMIQMENIIDELKKGEKKIPGLLEDIQNLGKARLMAYSEMSLYIGAIIEKTERFQPELEALQKKVETSPSPEVQDEYENAKLAMQMLMHRTNDMYTNHQASLTGLYTLSKMKSVLGDVQMKIMSHRTNSPAQWNTLLAENVNTANVADLANTVKTADDFGMKVMENTIKTRNAATDQMQKSMRQGTLDPKRVIKLIEEDAERVKRDQADYDKQITDMSENMKQLTQAGNKMRQALAENELARANPSRFLEQVKKHALPEATKPGKNQSNDNNKPEKLEAPKKNGTENKPSRGAGPDLGPH